MTEKKTARNCDSNDNRGQEIGGYSLGIVTEIKQLEIVTVGKIEGKK